ncbi:MAG TPA: MBL fold metallo-hydrolase [Anaerolineae bacterium]|nr:MBL fold metallo-hydrolase [Anaerolineae bacterium]
MLEERQYGPVVAFRSARTFFGRGYYYTAAYYVDTLLIDSGCAYSAAELAARLKPARPVSQIVNTHCHEDHIGANGLLQSRFGCRIAAHPLALPVLENPRLQPLQPYRRFFWGWPLPSHGQFVDEWVQTEHHCFRVIPTPGHSPDHIALFEPQQGWLFSGDAYIGGRDRAARPDYDVVAMIRSLRTLASLEIAALFPGSGTVRQNRPADELARKAAQLEELGESIKILHAQGHSPAKIRDRLLGREGSLFYMTLGHFSGEHLVELFLKPSMEEDGEGGNAGLAALARRPLR